MGKIKIKIPFIYEILLCVLMIILFRISASWKYFIYSAIGIISRSIFTDIIGILTHILVFSIVFALGLKIQKRTLVSVCSFTKVNALVWCSLVLCTVGFVLFRFFLSALFDSFLWGWFTDYYTDENILFTNIVDHAVIPAIAEELLFKGLLYFTLRKRFNVFVSVIISSLLFAGCHLDLIQFIPLFLFSCFTFWVYLRTGNIILPMFIHFINNLFVFIMLWEPFSEPATFFAALILFFSGAYLFNKASKKEGKK